MKIGGLQKLTLLDYPGKVACTVFLQGCNFRCPFCHNAPLLGDAPELEREALLDFLRARRGLLDGVAVTGGEPLLHAELAPFLRELKALGYAVKLDTNGSFPERLRALLEEGLLDAVAMDIKNAPEKYALTAGAAVRLPDIARSVRLLQDAALPYCEFRTTVVDELHEPSDFRAIGAWLRGAEHYFLQSYKDSANVLTAGLHAPSPEKLRQCLTAVGAYIPNAKLRGI